MKNCDEICKEIIEKIHPILQGNEISENILAMMKALIGLADLCSINDEKLKKVFCVFVDGTKEARDKATCEINKMMSDK